MKKKKLEDLLEIQNLQIDLLVSIMSLDWLPRNYKILKLLLKDPLSQSQSTYERNLLSTIFVYIAKVVAQLHFCGRLVFIKL